ncbi:UNVERIFIED_CONTAM: Maltose excess protein 1, chloroplastic [Sesamum latifolium]|uniref:Maltose excess protein 1, chloroplastic n=1 Tax=Sesamum latifolium TaxID=2727402 RepID=A0AAW2VRY3_9LAMI
MGKLSDKGVKFLGLAGDSHSSFQWMGLLHKWLSSSFFVDVVALAGGLLFNHDIFLSFQWTNLLNPDNIKGLSAVSMLLAMIGNGLMIQTCTISFGFYVLQEHQQGVLLGFNPRLSCLDRTDIWRDTQAHGLSSPFTSLKQLVFGP